MVGFSSVVLYNSLHCIRERDAMSKTVSAIRFESEEKEWINAFAQVNGKSFSAQVRQWTLERLEDELDARDLADAIKANDKDDLGISVSELMEKYHIA